MKENKKIEKIRDKGRLIFFAILFIGANISSLNLSFSHSLTILIQVLILIIALIILAINEKQTNKLKNK